MQSVGAYYQCHKNAASFVRTIYSFKEYYPDSDIIVVNDGGYNYRPFCEKHKIKYTYIEKMNTVSSSLIFSSYDNCISFLKNLFDNLNNIKESHIILLEDDVRILKQHTKPFMYTINGCNKNERLNIIIENILKKKGYNGPFYYGGCGGCVIDKTFFQSIPFSEIEKLIHEIKNYPHLFASDILLSFIALYFGGSIGQYEEFAETWYPNIQELIINKNVAFLHQFKSEYEKNGIMPTHKELSELEDYLSSSPLVLEAILLKRN